MNSSKINKIHLYNTLTRKKEIFTPCEPGVVGLYSCGPTVYNYPHIGNYRAYIFADILKRTLRYGGYQVKHIMNLTDVDDKTIRESQKEGRTLKEFTEFYTEEFLKDIKSLNILEPDKFASTWEWYEIDHPPEPLFEFCALAIECHKTGRNYLDVADLKK